MTALRTAMVIFWYKVWLISARLADSAQHKAHQIWLELMYETKQK